MYIFSVNACLTVPVHIRAMLQAHLASKLECVVQACQAYRVRYVALGMPVHPPDGSPLHVSQVCAVCSPSAPLFFSAIMCFSMLTPQLGILVQHREACRSTLSFLTRLLDPGTALARLQEQQQQRQMLGGTALDTTAVSTALLQSQLDRVGPSLSRMLMGAVVGALPYSRVADIAPVIQVGWGSRWAGTAVLEDVSLEGNAGKLRLCIEVLAQQWAVWQTYVSSARATRCLSNGAACNTPCLQVTGKLSSCDTMSLMA